MTNKKSATEGSTKVSYYDGDNKLTLGQLSESLSESKHKTYGILLSSNIIPSVIKDSPKKELLFKYLNKLLFLTKDTSSLDTKAKHSQILRYFSRKKYSELNSKSLKESINKIDNEFRGMMIYSFICAKGDTSPDALKELLQEFPYKDKSDQNSKYGATIIDYFVQNYTTRLKERFNHKNFTKHINKLLDIIDDKVYKNCITNAFVNCFSKKDLAPKNLGKFLEGTANHGVSCNLVKRFLKNYTQKVGSIKKPQKFIKHLGIARDNEKFSILEFYLNNTSSKITIKGTKKLLKDSGIGNEELKVKIINLLLKKLPVRKITNANLTRILNTVNDSVSKDTIKNDFNCLIRSKTNNIIPQSTVISAITVTRKEKAKTVQL